MYDVSGVFDSDGKSKKCIGDSEFITLFFGVVVVAHQRRMRYQCFSLKDIDGVSLIPFLNGPRAGRLHQTLYQKKETRVAIGDGDWNLIRLPNRPAQLYSLAEDISKKSDLADKYPEKVKELYKKNIRMGT